jgi:hypothetical protein
LQLTRCKTRVPSGNRPATVHFPQYRPRPNARNVSGTLVFRLFFSSSREEPQPRRVALLRNTALTSFAPLGVPPPDPGPLLCWEMAPPTPTPTSTLESTTKSTSRTLGGQASGFRPVVAGVVGPTPSPGPEWSTGSPELFRTAPRLPMSASFTPARYCASEMRYRTRSGWLCVKTTLGLGSIVLQNYVLIRTVQRRGYLIDRN